MGRPSRVASVVVCAAVAGQVSRLGALAPLLAAAVLVLGNVGLVRWARWRQISSSSVAVRLVGPLTVCWLVVLLLPVHKFSHRGVAQGPTLSTEALLEVLVYAGAGLVALAGVRMLEPTLDRSHPPVLLFLYPAWVMLSVLWGLTGPYAFVRGAQLVATALLAWATIAVGRRDLVALTWVVEGILRWFVRVTLVFVALGAAFGPLYVFTSAENRERFTWIGAHPLAAGLILSIAVVMAVAAPLRVLRVPPWARMAMVVVFAVALLPNHSRQSWFTLAVVLVVGLQLAGRITPLVRWIGIPLLGAAAVAAVMYRSDEIWSYLLRNDSSDSLLSGNGRLSLWGIGFRALDTPFDWAFGLGHGITKTVFLEDAPWAATAHSSFLAALVSTGLIGLGLFVALLAGVVGNTVSTRLWRTSRTGFVVSLLLVIVLTNGLVTDAVAEPNLGFSLLYLVAAVALVHRGRTAAVSAGPAPAGDPIRRPPFESPAGAPAWTLTR